MRRRVFIPMLMVFLNPTAVFSQSDLKIQRNADDIIISWNGGGVLQTTTTLTDWEAMLNSPSPFRLPQEELQSRQFFGQRVSGGLELIYWMPTQRCQWLVWTEKFT